MREAAFIRGFPIGFIVRKTFSKKFKKVLAKMVEEA